MAETAESKWSQLPKDLLHNISKTFNTHLDVISVRSVCSSWRSSIPPFKKNPPLPLNLPFPIAPNPALNPNRRGHFSLTQSTIYILQNPNSSKSTASASKPWLIRVEETRRGKLRPLNPLSRILTENTPVAYPKSLNLLDTRISEIGKQSPPLGFGTSSFLFFYGIILFSYSDLCVNFERTRLSL